MEPSVLHLRLRVLLLFIVVEFGGLCSLPSQFSWTMAPTARAVVVAAPELVYSMLALYCQHGLLCYQLVLFWYLATVL